MRKISVGDVMTRNFVSVSPGASLHDCAKKMVRERVNSLVVARGNKLVGILTARDVLWAVMKKSGTDLKEIGVLDVAVRKVAVVKPSADISQAIAKMKLLNFRRLPVLSNSELIGVITLKDILSVEPAFYNEVQDFVDVREESRKRNLDLDWPIEGLCENCGALSELLKVEGTLLCPDCRDELY